MKERYLELDHEVKGRLWDPVIKRLYEDYSQLGITHDLYRFIDNIPEPSQSPIIHTLSSHVTKEKPLFIYSLGRSLGVSHEDSSAISASIDLLWSLSLMYDDIFDRDKKRAGKEAAWIRYGEDSVMKAANYGVKVISDEYDSRFGQKVTNLLEQSLEISVNSLKKNALMTLDTSESEIKSNYLERSHFHADLPIEIIGQLSSSEDYQNALDAIVAVNLAGQIMNDYKDMSPNFTWLRESFSDIRAGMVTIPISIMYKRSSHEQRLFLEKIFGKGSLTELEMKDIFKIMEDTSLAEETFQKVDAIYQESVEAFHSVLDENYLVWPEIWIEYKYKQIRNLIK